MIDATANGRTKKVITDLIGKDTLSSFLQQFPNYFPIIQNNPLFLKYNYRINYQYYLTKLST